MRRASSKHASKPATPISGQMKGPSGYTTKIRSRRYERPTPATVCRLHKHRQHQKTKASVALCDFNLLRAVAVATAVEMTRQVISKKDVAAGATAAANNYGAEESSMLIQPRNVQVQKPDGYFDRFLKYIPSEIIVVYVTICGMLGENANAIALWIIYALSQISVPIWREEEEATVHFVPIVLLLGGGVRRSIPYHW